MFDSLKKKFNSAIGKISDKVSEDAEEEAKQMVEEISSEEIEEKEEDISEDAEIVTTGKEEEQTSKKSFFPWKRGESSEEEKELKEDLSTEDIEDENSLPKEEKSGIFSFIREKTISEKDIDDILWELEMSLLESDVALEVAETIVNSVKDDLIGKKIKRRNDIAEFTRNALKDAISKVLNVDAKDLSEMAKESRKSGDPLKIMFVGINGTGKTTTIAKIATFLKNEGYTPVIAAADTFRAGAIEQISHHADNIGIKIIKHQKGADPAAVAYDAVEHAKAKSKEIVLIDTAGRMQTNVNLMDEMKKIKRVVNPEIILFVGDALTGNDAVEQASKFDDAVGVNGIILTKADADAKGGAALSIGYVINKPIMFLGVGQSYEDIMEFNPEWMVEQIVGAED
ncbi:MAG: signal recognition particle-docking protein FtsY [Methanomicrobiales archaeon]